MVSNIGTILTASLGLYALVTGMFLISENRRPQATLAWMLALVFAPGIGLLIYILFGRDRKAFSKLSRLLRQDLEANARPCWCPCYPARTRRSPGSRARAPAAEGS